MKLTIARRRGPRWSCIAGAAVLAASTVAMAAETVRIGGTGSAVGTMRLLAEEFHKTGTQTRVTVLPALGSGGGVKAALSKAADLAVTSRPLNKSELERGAVEMEYGRSPLVAATWAGNPLTDVSRAELAEIYAGRRSAWPDGTLIRLVLRPATDVDSELVKGLSAGVREAMAQAERRPGMTFADTDSDAVDAIEKVPGSLGWTTLAQILSEKRRVKLLKLDGVEGHAKTLAEERYPLYKRLYIVIGPQPGAGAREFIAFLRSQRGRELLEKTGHVTGR